jgi:DNA-binding NtrC family response regulator
MPPLRERREDIPLLVDYFIKKFNMKLNKDIATVSPGADRLLMSYAWPGNVRELEHALEHAILLSRTPVIEIDDLPAELEQFHEVGAPCVSEGEDDLSKAILKALEKTAWNKSKAALLLGMSRSTLYRKISDYNLNVEDPFQKPGPS